jgi:hypothetical protein
MTMTELRGPALTSWAWPFSFSDLTAGLRKYLSDPTLAIGDVRPMTLPFQKPAIGRVRGIEVQYRTRKSTGSLALVVKEPVGSTRIGLAGVGRREVGVYRHLASQLPLAMPKFVAGSPHGDWLILEAISFGRSPSSWTKAVFDDAIDGLIRLHDRFWGLREDLGNFAWLSRPLEGDFDVYLAAATNAIERIVRQGTPASLAGSPERVALLKRLTEQAAAIAAPLRQEMATLLHGDYWPGNIALDRHGRMVVYDWQLTGIGPGILDLLTFVKKAEWWFPGAPLSSGEIIARYREGVAGLQGQRWDDADWDRLWDHALLWRFLQEWLDLLAAIPESLLVASADQLERVWLDPGAQARARRLG